MVLIWLAFTGRVGGALLSEDFSTDPAARGWRLHGDATLFRWNTNSQRLEVTWDSARSNSFFYHPMPSGLALNKTDDFSFAFDLRFSAIAAGVRPNKPGPFEIAVGLINTANATNAGFSRGNLQCPNLVEFDYFPSGLGPGGGVIADTVSPMIMSSNRQPATSFTFPLTLTSNDWFRITLTFTASNRTLATVMTRNGQPFGPINNVVLAANFTGFSLDAVSVTSYSDTGDNYGSVLAHGEIDNLVVLTPDPPRPQITGAFSNTAWQVFFTSRTNWQYTLERTTDFTHWAAVSAWAAGTGNLLALVETNMPAAPRAFYRVQLRRP